MYDALRILGRAIAFVLYGAGVLVVLPTLLFLILPYGWPLLPFVVVVLVGLQRRVQRGRAAIVLGHLGQALRLNLPLAPMMEAAAASETSRVRGRLRVMADRLELGEPVWRAVREAAPEVPDRATAILERAEALGRLPEALDRLRGEARLEADRDFHRGGIPLVYPLIVAWIALLATVFFLIFVGPQFIEIFEDYDVQPPALTQQMMGFGDWLTGRGRPVPGLVLLGGCLALVAIIWVAWAAEFGRGLLRPVLWWAPVFARLERSRGHGDVCFVLQEAVAAGAPMDAALRQAMALDTNPVLQRRVARWQLLVESGEPLADAARAAHMPRLVSGMLGVAETSGSIAEALGFLRRFYDGRHAAAAALARASAGPAALLVVAVAVATVVLSLFLPLVAMIEAANTWAQGWTP